MKSFLKINYKDNVYKKKNSKKCKEKPDNINKFKMKN